MTYIKSLTNFIIEHESRMTIVAKIRYSDEQRELMPLYKKGIQYVQRFSDTKTAYYKLEYNSDKEYAYLGEEVPDNYFEDKHVASIESKQYREYIEKDQ